MGGHHHHGGHRGGRGWGGYPVIIEEYWDDPSLAVIGAERKVIPLVLGTAAPISSTSDAALVAAASAPLPSAPATSDKVAAPAAPIAVANVPQPESKAIPAGGAAAGAGVGFLVGGPIGALAGLAIGFLGGKAVAQQKAKTVAIVPPPTTTPKVSGETCWDSAAGWSPHGDERMR